MMKDVRAQIDRELERQVFGTGGAEGAYIGITGFTTSAEVRGALEALPDVGRKLMVGVLATWRTIGGEASAKPLRYPRRESIASIFVEDERCLNLVHYGAAGGEEARLADDLIAAMGFGGPLCHGLQVNAPWPSPKALLAFRVRFPKARLVLQVGPRALEMENLGDVRERLAVLHDYDGIVTDLLIDVSAGHGVPIMDDKLFLASEIWRSAREALKHPMGVGFAGGLDAAAFPRGSLAAGLLWDGMSCDAEGRLRDDAPGGGNLDLAKVRAYLAAAGEAVFPR